MRLQVGVTMKLVYISIKYYMGIETLSNLKLGDMNTFVGKNDNGKSTILKALNAFFNDKFTTHDVYKDIPDGQATEITLRFSPGQSINALALDHEGYICLTKKFSFTAAGKLKKEKFYTCNDFEDGGMRNSWGVKETGLNDMLSGLDISFSRSGRGVTNLSKLELLEANAVGYKKVLTTHLDDEFSKNLIKQYPTLVFPEYYLFDAEQNLNVGATEFQNQFKPIVNDSLNANSALTEQIERNVKSDLSDEFSIITELMKKNVPNIEAINPEVNYKWDALVKFGLNMKFSGEDHEIPITHKGTGFKRLLMVAYFEYLSQKDTSGNKIFGLEEPETYLHPELQYDLLNSILDMSDTSQFLVTTHSPVFAGATQQNNIIVVKKELPQSTYNTYENDHEILDEVINELGIRPNYNLINENYRKIVFVEGKGDCLFWQCAIGKLTEYSKDDILFIPCGGEQVEFFVNASLCQKLNRRFIFVLDSDKGAVDFDAKLENKRELKQKIEDMGGSFQILRKREIENYYHRDAIVRKMPEGITVPDDFIIEDYSDIKEEIKSKILSQGRINFKAKNNMSVFNEMTSEEWREVGFTIESGGTDIEIIISEIIS